MADGFGVVDGVVDGQVAGGYFEVVVAQFDADGLAHIAFALQVVSHTFAQIGEDGAEFCLVSHRVQIAVKGGFTAHADRLAVGYQGAVIASPGGVVHPHACALTKAVEQQLQVCLRQFANGVDSHAFKLGVGFGANAVDLLASQWPDLGLQVRCINDRDALWLVELAGHLGNQLVGGHPDGAAESSGVMNAFLQQACEHTPALALTTGHMGEIDVDLVHATVFHHGGDVGDDAFEKA